MEADQLATFIQEAKPDEVEGILIGWVLVSEWAAPDGFRWLTRSDGNSVGESIPSWQREGYLHNALNAMWEVEEE